jgi:hypothetical protein
MPEPVAALITGQKVAIQKSGCVPSTGSQPLVLIITSAGGEPSKRSVNSVSSNTPISRLARTSRAIRNELRDSALEDAYFVLMLCIMAVAGVLAKAIQLPGIVGAFLAGLAVNASARDKPASAKRAFLGKSLFIPIFFIVTGFLINPITFALEIYDNFPLVAAVIAALLVGKWIAAWVVGRSFGYTRNEQLTVWSLTLPQVAAMLAATLVAHDTLGPSFRASVECSYSPHRRNKPTSPGLPPGKSST